MCAQELQAMPGVLDVLPAGFALDLAVVAAHRGALQLEPWLAQRIASLQMPFVQVLPNPVWVMQQRRQDLCSCCAAPCVLAVTHAHRNFRRTAVKGVVRW